MILQPRNSAAPSRAGWYRRSRRACLSLEEERGEMGAGARRQEDDVLGRNRVAVYGELDGFRREGDVAEFSVGSSLFHRADRPGPADEHALACLVRDERDLARVDTMTAEHLQHEARRDIDAARRVRLE